jgi:hypothetical protein
MNNKQLELMERRDAIQARIATQREQLRQVSTQLAQPLALLDQGIAGLRYLRRHPLLSACVVAVLLVRRGGMLGMISSGFKLWGAYRSLRSLAEKFSSQ